MSFRPYNFTMEVWTKTAAQNESGQPKSTWALDRTIKVDYMASRNEERLVGTIENPFSYIIWTNDLNLSVSNQLRNLKTRYGDLIDGESFNITGVKTFHGWSMPRESRVVAQKINE